MYNAERRGEERTITPPGPGGGHREVGSVLLRKPAGGQMRSCAQVLPSQPGQVPNASGQTQPDVRGTAPELPESFSGSQGLCQPTENPLASQSLQALVESPARPLDGLGGRQAGGGLALPLRPLAGAAWAWNILAHLHPLLKQQDWGRRIAKTIKSQLW